MYGVNSNGYVGYGISPYQMQNVQNRMTGGNDTMQYPTYPSYQSQQTNIQQVLKGRPVSSYDEAKASMIDLDGSLFVFTDIANGKIYTKQILLDGSAELKTYALEQMQEPETKQTTKTRKQEYVSRKEFDTVMKQLNKKIEELSSMEVYDNDVKSNADIK